MPLKRPKAEPLPKPFRDIERAHGDSDRFRIKRMQTELDQLDGLSFNTPRPGLAARMAGLEPHRAWAMIPALGMGALVVGGFFIAANTGMVPPTRIIWTESWAATRTAEDALAAREAALAELRANVEATIADAEARRGSDPDAAGQIAALRRWAAMAEQEEKQRRLELERRAAAAADPTAERAAAE